MAITPIQDSITTALTRQSTPLSTSTVNSTTTTGADTASTSEKASLSNIASQLVHVAGLQSAAVNVSQLGSLLETAQNTTGQAATILQQLQGLAQQAQSGGSTTDPKALNNEFQLLLSQLQEAVGNGNFGGTNLLDGSFSGTDSSSANGASSLSLPSLTTQSLFGTTSPNLLTPANAANAAASVSNALNLVSDTSNNLQGLQAQAEFTAAGVQSVLANTIASSSTLTESDLSSGAIDTAFSQFIATPKVSAQAQTGNMPANILSLLQE